MDFLIKGQLSMSNPYEGGDHEPSPSIWMRVILRFFGRPGLEPDPVFVTAGLIR